MSGMVGESPLVWSWWGWEPLSFYLDGKTENAVVHGLTVPQLRQWWAWLHDEETVRQAAEMGVTWIVTHYVKGYGLKAEADERAWTAELVRRCHRHGIRVIGYVQYGTLFHKSFFLERPEAAGWIQRGEDGSPLVWWGDERRFLPCLEADGYREYLKDCIRAGLMEAGLDGLHFDNFYSRPCHCDRCRQTFQRQFGMDLPSDCELLDGKLERKPGAGMVAGGRPSSAVRTWIDWRARRLAELMDELQAYARSLKPDVAVIWNPSAIRGTLDQRAFRATDFLELGRRAQMQWAESGNFPCVSEGVAVHQVNLFKTARALGYKAFSTAWRSSSEGLGLPDRVGMLTLQMAEAVAFGAEMGNNWMMRPEYFGQFPESALCRHWAKLVAYVKNNQAGFGGNSADGGCLGLYFSAAAARESFSEDYGRFLTAQQLLLEEHIPFDLLFDDGHEDSYAMVWDVLGGQWRFADGERKAVEAFDSCVSGAYASTVVLDERTKALGRQLRQRLETTGEFAVEGLPKTVFVERRNVAHEQRHVVHLVNYDWERAVSGARLVFCKGTPASLRREVQMTTPEIGVWLDLAPDADGVVELPDFGVWATLAW